MHPAQSLPRQMHPHRNNIPPNRYNNYHGPKRQLVGNHAGHVPPAWRVGNPVTGAQVGAGGHPVKGGARVDAGSKIFLSQLPVDVGEVEIDVSAQHSRFEVVAPTI